jgi:hypothetical protein
MWRARWSPGPSHTTLVDATPDALRKFRGWAAGEVLLLSASPADGVLVLSSTALLDSLVVLDACA